MIDEKTKKKHNCHDYIKRKNVDSNKILPREA